MGVSGTGERRGAKLACAPLGGMSWLNLSPGSALQAQPRRRLVPARQGNTARCDPCRAIGRVASSLKSGISRRSKASCTLVACRKMQAANRCIQVECTLARPAHAREAAGAHVHRDALEVASGSTAASGFKTLPPLVQATSPLHPWPRRSARPAAASQSPVPGRSSGCSAPVRVRSSPWSCRATRQSRKA